MSAGIDGVVGTALSKADLSTPAGRAFVTRTPVITEDLRQPHDFVLPQIYFEHHIVSSANVVIDGYGVLEIDSPAPRSFVQDEVIFLTGFANVVAEMVSRVRREQALRDLVAEQATFLRELQHRVRNHLHILSSSGQMLARQTTDEAARRGFDDLVRRILSLASLYDRLLGVGMARQLELGGYLQVLCANIAAFEGLQERGIELKVQAAPADVDVEKATAIGLITNELIANSVEHAFPDRPGRIVVELRAAAPGRLRLAVIDNGVGMPEQTRGTGLGLVHRLARQLGGRLERVTSRDGTRWELELALG